MKLNLLPTYVSKGKQAAAAWVVFAVIIVACVLLTVGMISVSGGEMKAAKARADALEGPAANAVKLGQLKDDELKKAQGVIVNSMLAQAMIKHSRAYPDFYDKMMPYIPSFFRITSMTAAPQGEDSISFTLTGVVKTQEQYRDLMLALNRIPGAKSVARSGYNIVEQYVPSLVPEDQTGRKIARADGQHIPDDPLDRMNYYIQQGMKNPPSPGGGFGTGEPGMKGAMNSDWSLVTVTVIVSGDLRTPDPRATLAGTGLSATTTTASAPTSAPSMPTGPTGAPPAGNKPPAAPSKTGSSGGGSGQAASTD